MDISAVEPGTSLFSQALEVSEGAVAAYLSSVEDTSDTYLEERVAPPLAVAALVMAEALKAIDLPGGSVHTGQELEFTAPVSIGTTVQCSATVAQNTLRRGTRFVAIEIVGESNGQRAVRGKVSLAVPQSEGGA